MRNLHFVIDRKFVFEYRWSFLWMLVAVLCFSACKKSEELQFENLYGRWDISKAERNGKETNYLRNGYFIINQSGNMTVNITGQDETGAFVLDKSKIMMEGHKTFDILTLQGDSMKIKYISSPNTQFIFYMSKKKGDAE